MGIVHKPVGRGPRPVETILLLACIALIEYYLPRFIPLHGPAMSAASLYRVALLRSVQCAVVLTWFALTRRSLDVVGIAPSLVNRGVQVGFLACVALGGFATLTELVARAVFSRSFLAMLGGPEVHAPGALLLAGVVVGPFAEELVFRALIYGAARRRLNATLSIAATTLLFLGAHYLAGTPSWVQAAGGVIFCLAYEYSHSLIAPYMVHALGNLVLFSLPWLLKTFG